eukprot:SAG22_NODE_110_length_19679_cov_45.046527_19_plen_496_part_00
MVLLPLPSRRWPTARKPRRRWLGSYWQTALVRQRSSLLKAVITAFPSVSLPFLAVPLRSHRTVAISAPTSSGAAASQRHGVWSLEWRGCSSGGGGRLGGGAEAAAAAVSRRAVGLGQRAVRQRSSLLKAVITAFPCVSLPFFAVPLLSQRTVAIRCTAGSEPRSGTPLTRAISEGGLRDSTGLIAGQAAELAAAATTPAARKQGGTPGAAPSDHRRQVSRKVLPFCCASTVFLAKTVPFRAVLLSQEGSELNVSVSLGPTSSSSSSVLVGSDDGRHEPCPEEEPGPPLRLEPATSHGLAQLAGARIDDAELDFHFENDRGERVQRRLGEGSFGVVFRAVLRPCTPVAVKVQADGAGLAAPSLGLLHGRDAAGAGAAGAAPSAMEGEAAAAARRFEREIVLAKSLVHPNIVQCLGYAIGRAPGGGGGAAGVGGGAVSLMLVMEFMERGSLWDLVRAGKLRRVRWRARVQMLLDVANGVAHIHRHGVAHRDLKVSEE